MANLKRRKNILKNIFYLTKSVKKIRDIPKFSKEKKKNSKINDFP